MTERPIILTLDQIKKQAPPVLEKIATEDPRGPIETLISRMHGQIVYVVPGSTRWTHPEAAPVKRGKGEEV